MGRTYAGVLGLLAFQTVMVRGLLRSAGAETVYWQASLALFGFAALGYITGNTAAWIVGESVRSSMAAEAAAQRSEQPAQAG